MTTAFEHLYDAHLKQARENDDRKEIINLMRVYFGGYVSLDTLISMDNFVKQCIPTAYRYLLFLIEIPEYIKNIPPNFKDLLTINDLLGHTNNVKSKED